MKIAVVAETTVSKLYSDNLRFSVARNCVDLSLYSVSSNAFFCAEEPGSNLVQTSSSGYSVLITAIHSISTKTSLGRRETSTQARAGAVSDAKYSA